MLLKRPFWSALIESAWKDRPIIWLSGPRRIGKTFLCQTLPKTRYFDCEKPSVRSLIEKSPEAFLESLGPGRTVLDEIHRLRNPSELLKLAADHYPGCRILATGSSTLGASLKFRDTLAGRKREIRMTPMVSQDLEAFRSSDLEKRLQKGGLPPFFMSRHPKDVDYQEWLDAYWAKDIEELFRLERKASFHTFFQLLMAQSGGIFEAVRFSGACEVSRPTIKNYLSILEETHIVHVIRPYSSRMSSEIISAPKVYGFDTGFVSFYKGWGRPKSEGMGLLWEHYVLNELAGRLQLRQVRYWRDKRGHEVDFVLLPRGGQPIAIECKWSSLKLDPAGLMALRRRHSRGRNYVVLPGFERTENINLRGLRIRRLGLENLISELRRFRLG